MIYFAVPHLASGQSVSTTLPTANADGTGSCAFMLNWVRDTGKNSINTQANLVVTQNGNTLVSVGNASIWGGAGIGSGAAAFAPSPSGGAITITNNGPGSIDGVSIADPVR
jgi:hypothetical protein